MLARTADEAARTLEEAGTISVRGGGLSYCQAGAASGATVLRAVGVADVIAIDDDLGTVTVESGCTMGSLARTLALAGRWFPVLPGHPAITVGGCVAFNTHGKTQHDVGQMSDRVLALTLVHPDHGEIRCSRKEHPELLDLTIGGMGLTGWVLDVTLTTDALPGWRLSRTSYRTRSFLETVEVMESLDDPGTRLYSWNDARRSGERFGAGLVFAERIIEGERGAEPKFRRLDPQRRGNFVPVCAWNRATTAAANRVYRAATGYWPRRDMSLLNGAFPINGREGYFHAFGRRGFREYQVIIPRAEWPDVLQEIQGAIETTRACVTLASLKRFSGAPKYLWFRGQGVCLALDAPADERTLALFERLDAISVEAGAPVNLAKDSRLDASTVEAIFPGYDAFRQALREFDPARRIDSELRRRIGV